MSRLTLLIISLVIGFSTPALAGFEWVPPSENPAPVGPDNFDFPVLPPEVADRMVTPIYQAPVIEQAPMPSNDPFMAHKSPAPSSIYGAYQTTPPAQPQMGLSPRAPQARPTLSNTQDRAVSLYIDPYPMGRESVNANAREMHGSSIEQAMMERGGKVSPLSLGQNLDTGAQIAYAERPTVQTPINNPIGGMSPDSMVPIGTMGGIQTAPVNAMPIRQYAQAIGFGADLPLALALNQVIPSEFVHSFALGVDPGTTVSWQGGKPWDQVLNDMLRPAGLTAVIKQNTVTIQPMMNL